jgi:hypothetical protein
LEICRIFCCILRKSCFLTTPNQGYQIFLGPNIPKQ